ncbi:MAG: cytochrome P460 family protein [Gemmatimonadota bacterium]
MTKSLLGTVLLAFGIAACNDGPDDGADASTGVPAAESVRDDSIAGDLFPRFTPAGELMRPEGWEAWILAGTSMGLTYTESATVPGPGEPPGRFLNVYIQPWAYEHLMKTGAFPEGTMFVLAGADPVRKADPARGGFYQGELSLLEVHLKKEDLHESGWGFYGFGGGEETASLIPGEAACYSCHRDEAAFDQVFVQFYPAMWERLGLEPADEDSTGGES